MPVAGGERQKRDMRDDGDDGPLPLKLVFCNTVASCLAAEHALAEPGVSSLCYHDDQANLKEFRRDGGSSVLVCTILHRGDLTFQTLIM